MPPKAPKGKEVTTLGQSLYSNSSLPVWDDAAVAQENWGSNLTGQTAGATTKPKAPKEPPSPTNFSDADGNTALEKFINTNYTLGKVGENSARSFSWQKPEEIMKPFRPVVHRNTTPFLDPYANPSDLRALQSLKEAEEVAEDLLQKSAQATSKKASSKEAAAPEASIHERHPEIVTFLEEMVTKDVEYWRGVEAKEVVQKYRELPALMQPYDPTLTAGCAETPAEACGSRYSTALRHKLQRAEALATLESMPPFLMSSFNSALMIIEEAQNLIPQGNYLWELIYPQAPGTHHPVYNPGGKYLVKLFFQGAWRKVVIDDKLPVDELGRPLLTITDLKELWPALLAKALIKCFKEESNIVFFDAPELLLSCFTGNWLPHYYDFRAKDAVHVTALLIKYMHLLESQRQQPLTESIKEGEAEAATASAHSGTTTTEAAPSQSERPTRFCQLLATLRSPDKSSNTPGLVSGAQLFSIVDITPLRNTLAIHVRTTPQSDLQEGFFQRERNAPDVIQILSRQGGSGSAVPTEKEKSTTNVWLTAEELGEQMNYLLMLRDMEGLYANHIVVDYHNMSGNEMDSPPLSSEAGSALLSNEASVAGLEVKKKTAFLHVNCTKEEELTLVTHSRLEGFIGGPEWEGGAGQGSGTASDPNVGFVSLINEVYLEHYQWNRCHSFSHVSTLTYELAKVKATILRLPKGTHLFRITVPRMARGDALLVLSNATVEVKPSITDFSSSENYFAVVDADYYSSFSPTGPEQILFKRKIKVTEDTEIAAVMNGFPATTDPAALRSVNGNITTKGKGPGAPSTNSKTNRKSISEAGAASGAPAESTPRDFDEFAFLAQVSLSIIDLDTQTTVTTGKLGRLIQWVLRANNKGYLLLAHTLSMTAEYKLVLSPRTKSIPKGVWKITVRSNVELGLFESIPFNASVVKLSGKLSRGGSHVLFSQAIAISESAHLSLLCGLHSAIPMPYDLTVTRFNGNFATLSLSNNGMSFSESHPDDVVFESKANRSRTFIPDLLVESGEKGKNSCFVVEGTVPKDRSLEWDEFMRLNHEVKFTAKRRAAEAQAEERRMMDLTDIENDPQAFEQKRLEEQSTQQQLQQEQMEARQHRDIGNASTSKRPRVSQEKKKGSMSTRRRSSDLFTSPQSPRSTSSNSNSDDPLDIQYQCSVYFSVAKVEQRSILPVDDCLNAIRSQWRQTLQTLQERAKGEGNALSSATNTPARGNSANTAPTAASQNTGKLSKQQQAAVAAEEIQRQEQGRQSRKNFLANPENIFFPSVEKVDEEKVIEKPRSNSRRHTSNVAGPTHVIVTQDPEDGEQRHQKPLEPSQYQIRLLPLREIDVVEATLVTSPVKPSSAAGRDKKGKGKGNSLSNAASSPTAYSAVLAEIEQAEEREKTNQFQQEFKTVSETIFDDAGIVLSDLQKSNTPFLEKLSQQFWESVGTGEEGLVFSSALGTVTDEGHSKTRQKSVSHS